jgi:hypothetical protein
MSTERDRPGADRGIEFCAEDAAIEAASEIFRRSFPDTFEETRSGRLRQVVAAMLECGLRRGEGCADLIEFVIQFEH